MFDACGAGVQIIGGLTLGLGFAYLRKLVLRLSSIQMTTVSLTLMLISTQWVSLAIADRLCG